jgi:REP element-mobilizing transposase RayT
MNHPIRPVLAYHLIVCAYGFWLPNDPRGSWSDIVRNPNLREFGPATKVTTHRSLARAPHDRQKRLAAKKALTYPPVIFTGEQARAIMRGVGIHVEKSNLTIWAAAVMPDHFHILVARHHYDIEIVANHMKGEATKKLLAEEIHPFQQQRKPNGDVPPCFGRKWWVVYLFSEEDILRTIRYVENNPIRAGLKPQKWPFVVPYPQHRLAVESTAPPLNGESVTPSPLPPS